MKLIEIIKYVVRFKSKLLGVFICFVVGVASLYLIIYLGQSIHRESDRRFHGYKLDLYSIIKKSNVGQVAPSQMRTLDIDVVDYLKHNFNYIYDAAPELRVVTNVQYGDDRTKVSVIGVFDEFRDVHGLKLSHGRFITRYDSAKAFCVIGRGLYERFRKSTTDSLIAKTIGIENQFYEIVGVLQSTQGFVGESSIDEEILVNYYTLAQYIIQPRITKITLRANPNKPIKEVTQYIERTLKECLGDVSLYEISNQQVFLATIIERYRSISIGLGIVGFISFVLGVWILLRSVGLILYESKSDLKFDSRSKTVSNKVITRTATVLFLFGLISGAGGVFLGSLFSSVIARVNGWITFLSIQASIVGICTSIAIAVVFGFIMTLRFLNIANESDYDAS